jgi:hypothetical protein
VVYVLTQRPMYVAWSMIALTGIVVITLLIPRRRYDEYHASVLANCLIVALVLTMIAIAVLYLIILKYPVDIDKKFGLFIDTHWVTVVLSDFAYVILCRRK